MESLISNSLLADGLLQVCPQYFCWLIMFLFFHASVTYSKSNWEGFLLLPRVGANFDSLSSFVHGIHLKSTWRTLFLWIVCLIPVLYSGINICIGFENILYPQNDFSVHKGYIFELFVPFLYLHNMLSKYQ